MTKEFVAEINQDVIIEALCDALELAPSDVKGPKRFSDLSDARCIAVHLIRKHTDLTLLEIALFIRRMNHSTVIYLLARYKDLLFGCEGFRWKVNLVNRHLKERGYDC